MKSGSASTAPRVIVALDFADAASALALADRLAPAACAVKIGKELFTAAGPDVVRACVARGFRVFLDLKYHDIPNTVSRACEAATRLGIWMLNVHAAGGAAMLTAAREGVERGAAGSGRDTPLLIGVTVLTSLSDADLLNTGVEGGAAQQVRRLAKLSQSCGLAGVVCSPREIAAVRDACGPDFTLVTPGIRLHGAMVDDQSRIDTPQAALHAGSDYLVIGRPITQARDPRSTLESICARLGEAA